MVKKKVTPKNSLNFFPFVEKKVPNSHKDWNNVLMEKIKLGNKTFENTNTPAQRVND